MALPLPKEKQLFRERRRIVKSWHRFYDPEIGRYITADPIGLVGGRNLYAYVKGNPLKFIDPFGTFGIELCTPWIPTVEKEWFKGPLIKTEYSPFPSIEMAKFFLSLVIEGGTTEQINYIMSILLEYVGGMADPWWKYTSVEIYEVRKYIATCIYIFIGKCGVKKTGPYPKEEYRETGERDWLQMDFQFVPGSEVPDEYKHYTPPDERA